MPILPGIDGERKMSKSLGNHDRGHRPAGRDVRQDPAPPRRGAGDVVRAAAAASRCRPDSARATPSARCARALVGPLPRGRGGGGRRGPFRPPARRTPGCPTISRRRSSRPRTVPCTCRRCSPTRSACRARRRAACSSRAACVSTATPLGAGDQDLACRAARRRRAAGRQAPVPPHAAGRTGLSGVRDAVHARFLRLSTSGHGAMLDLTDVVARVVLSAAGAARRSPPSSPWGPPSAVTTIEYEPGAVADFAELLERLVPRRGAYAHNRLNHDTNAHAHLRAALDRAVGVRSRSSAGGSRWGPGSRSSCSTSTTGRASARSTCTSYPDPARFGPGRSADLGSARGRDAGVAAWPRDRYTARSCLAPLWAARERASEKEAPSKRHGGL